MKFFLNLCGKKLTAVRTTAFGHFVSAMFCFLSQGERKPSQVKKQITDKRNFASVLSVCGKKRWLAAMEGYGGIPVEIAIKQKFRKTPGLFEWLPPPSMMHAAMGSFPGIAKRLHQHERYKATYINYWGTIIIQQQSKATKMPPNSLDFDLTGCRMVSFQRRFKRRFMDCQDGRPLATIGEDCALKLFEVRLCGQVVGKT